MVFGGFEDFLGDAVAVSLVVCGVEEVEEELHSVSNSITRVDLGCAHLQPLEDDIEFLLG